MNKKYLLCRRIFILGLILVFSDFTFLCALPPRPRRGRSKYRISSPVNKRTKIIKEDPLPSVQIQLPVTKPPKITAKTQVSAEKISAALSASSLAAAGAMPLAPGVSDGSAQVNLGQQESFINLPQTPRTGRQIIQHFVPDWQEKLLSTTLFTPAELDLVEQALINMDEYFYEISEDGQKVWLITEEWDYEDQFSHELEFTFKDISPEQKERIMGAGHAFGVLRPALLLVTLQNHVLVYEKVPPFPKTPVSRWANALVQLVRKGEKTDAFSLQVLDIYQANIKRMPAPKTDETWLAEYKANPEEFYNNSKVKTSRSREVLEFYMVKSMGPEGLELSHISAPDPKSGASTVLNNM